MELSRELSQMPRRIGSRVEGDQRNTSASSGEPPGREELRLVADER